MSSILLNRRFGLKNRSGFEIAFSIFVLLLAIYSLTYSGVFITDDEHILASHTLSRAFNQKERDMRVYGNSRVFSLSNLNGISATQALNIEPGQEILAAPLVNLAEFLHVGQIQSLFFLNIWVSALTAVGLFAGILLLGYSTSTALVLSLLFGLGTLVWPYTRTYFRDPLAMMFLTFAWGCAQSIKSRQTGRNRYLAWVGLVVFLSAGILSKNTILIAVPVLFLDIILRFSKLKTLPSVSWKKLSFFMGLLSFLLVLWSIILPRFELLARFTPRYYLFLIQFFFSTPHPNFFQALLGPIISPGKSIFLYSPVLILSVIALVRHPASTWSAWFYLLLLVIGQALFYDQDWWGHINWGLRFTLPAIPPLLMASAPIVENWMRSAKGQIGLLLLGVLSGLVQLIGILAPVRNYYVEMAAAHPSISDFSSLWDLKYSALVWHLKWILTAKSAEMAAIRVGASAVPILIGWILLIVLIILGLFWIKWRWLSRIAFGFSVGLMVLMLWVYIKDPAYYYTRVDLKAAQEKISQEAAANDLVLIKSYGTPIWIYMMNWSGPHYTWTSLPFYFPTPARIEEYHATHNPEVALDEISLSLLKNIPSSYQHVWLVLPDDTPGADLDLEVQWLINNSVSNRSWTFQGDQTKTRLFLFEIH